MTGDPPSADPPATSGDRAALGPGGAALGPGGADGGVPPVLDQAFDSGTLYALRAAVQAHAVHAGMPQARADDVVIAVHELAANAVRHGAGRGRLRMWGVAGVLRCQVDDDGATASGGRRGRADGRDDGQASRATRITPGPWPYLDGHGLWLVRLVADQMSVFSSAGGTRVTAVFVLPPRGQETKFP